MDKKVQKSAKKPNTPWRIGQAVLHILGVIVLWAMVISATLALIAGIAGSIFISKFSDYLQNDIIPKAKEYANSLELDNISLAQTSIIYYTDPVTGESRELQQLFSTENRIWVGIEDIPQSMVDATVSIEDKRYNDHHGVDWLRTVSAVQSFAGGDSSFGASTITQQLIKNLSKDDDITVNRKVQEIFRALAVEKRYSKDVIMEWYLNTIYLGEGCYGVQSAAEVYFGKDVSELTPAECASIIAITNNPSLYDPYISPNNNRKRQLTILEEMYKQGFLPTEQEYLAATSQEMVFHDGRFDEKTYKCDAPDCYFEGTRNDYSEGEDGNYYCGYCGKLNMSVKNNVYSYFVDTVYRDVINDLRSQYGYSENVAVQKLLTGGYSIYSTYSPSAQDILDNVYENTYNFPATVSTQQLQSAAVLIDNATGDIIAISGGVGEKTGSLSLNRATQSKLPTGSSVKPIAVYAPAIEAGVVTPATVLDDSPLYDNWPQNYYRNFSGRCSVLKGLMSSLNTISVKTLDRLGTQNSYDFLTQKLGITSLVADREEGGYRYSDIGYAPLGLGEQTDGLTVREMAQAFAVFPNNGEFRSARTYTTVVDATGAIVLDNRQEVHTALSPRTSFYMNYMLQKVITGGTGGAAYMSNMPVAGKTGTSSNNQRYWFAGYTPYYTAVVWCGFDMPEQIRLVSGSGNPTIPIWRMIMDPLHAGLEYRDFPWADGLGYYEICNECGKLATEACEKDIRGESKAITGMYLFYDDAPSERCDCHVLVKICRESGKIANEYCELVEGNTVDEVGMVLYDFAWEGELGEDHIYNPNRHDNICTIHTEESTKPADEENPDDGTGEPTEPTEPAEPTETTTDP